ncbi:MBOAT family protein [Sphingobacteriales bacterium UPWRP_1]|nr:membrane-bound O-acyltransferase family protein [Sphingobacteriales bacterium TSM_CSM]PSJ75718.1 MBOAT family protein [Sphingobacteriales bacterium UPWRP_1]
MPFNSIDFAVFLPVVFALFWASAKYGLRLQNFIILLASYIFYGWWNWRFLWLMFASTLLDFLVGLALQKQTNKQHRNMLLAASIAGNLGLLFFFKYYNFFTQSFVQAFTLLGCNLHISTLQIILPVGISFYTFQTLSYSIDVYRKKIEPTRNFIDFAAFVSFFPQLVAGPIERAANLLPQFYTQRVFSYHKAASGMRQILWGLFKKMVIADNCAVYADKIFAQPDAYGGSTLLLGALFFAFQIYGDFSGYSDIAIGTGRLFGFSLMRNFAYPYFSRDIAEFWRRWHISLSTWFRDYVYIPMGGSRGTMLAKLRNIMVLFLLSGFWHGANYTFIVWGALNALYFLPLLLLGKNRTHLTIVAENKTFPSVYELWQMLSTFCLTMLAWVFFRAATLEQAIGYISGIFSVSLFEIPQILPAHLLLLLLFFITIEWAGRDEPFAIAKTMIQKSRFARWSFYYTLIVLIYLFGTKQQPFIYFQF